MQRLINNIIAINVLVDVLLIFVKDLGIVKAALMLLLTLHLLIKHRGNHYHYNSVFIFSGYVLIIALISSDLVSSLINSIKILIPIVAVLIGFHYFDTKDKVKNLAKSMNIAMLILVINFLVCNTLGIGEASRYEKADEEVVFLMGQLTDNWNMFTYSILTVPIILVAQPKKKKYYTYFLAIFNTMLIVISIKRIAILGLLLGTAINASYRISMKKMVGIALIMASIAAITYPLYSTALNSRFEARADRFEEGSLEKESRYLETFFVWEQVESFEPYSRSFFGMEAFNSARNYADGRFGDRQLHIDYNNIVNTTGLVGLLLYLLIFVQLWRKFKQYTAGLGELDDFSITMKSTFISFFFIQFITSIAGQMYNISFRLILFIFLGSILGYFYQMSQNQQHESTHS